ncbi:MAG: adenylate/guanylate cyclase domain-containing protein [bacterium]
MNQNKLTAILSHLCGSCYLNFRSFHVKSRVIFALMGIIPFVLIIYLLFQKNIKTFDITIIFLALAAFSILLGFVLLRRSAEQLAQLAKATGIIRSWEKVESIKIKADEELNDIAQNFNVLLKNLKEQGIQLMTYAKDLTEAFELNQKEVELRTTLSRYVREDLVEKLMNPESGALFENERKEVTILFADIRSFTTITERMDAEEVVAMLNQFFSDMVEIIFKNNGVLDKFIGDNLMALFGFIPSENAPAADAIQAAIEMQEATERLMKERTKAQKETFEIGIGINTGVAIAGNVGSANRIDYTVIGDCVNVAARFEQMAKGGEIVIGEQTYRQVKGLFPLQKKGEIIAKNKTEPVKCYEVLKPAGRSVVHASG